MDIRSIDRRRRKWHNLKQKLGRTAMGCCGGAWPPKSSTIIDILAQPQDDEEQAITSNMITAIQIESEESSATRLLAAAPASTGMNLAMALAAERNLRAAPVVEEAKTLKRVIEETEGEWRRGSGEEGGRGGDWVCCVCMERKKGAAFIPCGHAFCRVCSGEILVSSIEFKLQISGETSIQALASCWERACRSKTISATTASFQKEINILVAIFNPSLCQWKLVWCYIS